MELEAFASLHREDVILNVSGSTEVSGRWQGGDHLVGVILPKVVRNLNMSIASLARRHRLMAIDDNIVMGLMQGDANRRWADLLSDFRVEDGYIAELWEYLRYGHD